MICPHCGRQNQLASNMRANNAKRPVTGDLSMCWKCRKMGIFVVSPDGLSVRMPTDEEMSKIMSDPDVREALGISAESYTPSEALKLSRRAS